MLCFYTLPLSEVPSSRLSSLLGTVHLIDSHSSRWFYLPFPAPCSSCTQNVCHITHKDQVCWMPPYKTKQSNKKKHGPSHSSTNHKKIVKPALKTTQTRSHLLSQFPNIIWTVNMPGVQRLPPYQDHLFLSKIDHYRQVSLQTILQ